MIITFNSEVFKTEDARVMNTLAEIINAALSEKFLLQIDNIIDLFYIKDTSYTFNESIFAKSYLSDYQKKELEEHIESIISKDAYITETHQKYLSNFTVGFQNDEISPLDASRIVSERSLIILENATNDWKFVRGIIDKYSKSKQRKSIYKLIKKSIDKEWLKAEQAGGKGQIKARIEDLSSGTYKNIYRYKILALFDSDRDNNSYIPQEQKKLIEFIKNKEVNFDNAVYELSDLIVWHMLYKREIENYLPFDIMLKIDGISTSDQEKLKGLNLNPNAYDFENFETFIPSLETKKVIPQLFENDWPRDLLESRCEHHKNKVELPNESLVEVSEIEEILLKIAKII